MIRPDEIAAALTYGFRPRRVFEAATVYRAALIAHVEERNYAAAHELRVGRAQSDWTAEDREDFKRRMLKHWNRPGGGPRTDVPFAVAAMAFEGVEATDEGLLEAAAIALTTHHDIRLADGGTELPLIASVVLTTGRQLLAHVGRDERKAVLAHWIRTEPVFGYFLLSDAYVHSIDEDPASHTTSKTETTDALLEHIGSRTGLRLLRVWTYRTRNGRVEFDEPRPDVDKRTANTSDPYADLFAEAGPAEVQ